jgi:hypothetical protein
MCGDTIIARDYHNFRVYCTRPKGHEGNHIAAVGPYTDKTPVLAEWPRSEAAAAAEARAPEEE